MKEKTASGITNKIAIYSALLLNILNIIFFFYETYSKIWTAIIISTLFIVFLLFVFANYKKRKIKLIVSFIVFLSLLALVIFNNPRSRLVLTEVRVVENSCQWLNLMERSHDNQKVIGFKENSIEVWKKWRWLPNESNLKNIYANTAQLKDIHNTYSVFILESKKLKNSVQGGINDHYCLKSNSIISDSTFEVFFYHLIESYLTGNQFINCLNNLWPAEDDLIMIKKRIPKLHESLISFKNDFLRTSTPIFNFIIQNNFPDAKIISKGIFLIKNIKVNTFPKNYGSYILESVYNYKWEPNNFENPDFIEWFSHESSKYPYGINSTYSEVISSDIINLYPKLVVKGDSPVSFNINIIGGYNWPCQIKFVFYTDENEKIESEWYTFKPTSNPEFNVFR